MSSALADVCMSKRWLTTTWNASPARISSCACSTAARKSGRVVRASKLGTASGSYVEVVDGAGWASSAVIRSSRETASAHASSTRSSVSSQFTAFATSSTLPSAWSSTARSVTSISASSGRCRSSAVWSGSRSRRRTASYPMKPTSPPVSGGRSGRRGVASAVNVSRTAASGSPPEGRPTGGVPSHSASPSRSVKIAAQRAPTNEYRDQTPPCSADSSRKVPGRSAASLR